MYHIMHPRIHMDTFSMLPYLDIWVLIYFIDIYYTVHCRAAPEGIQGFSGAAPARPGSWAWRRGRDAPMVAEPELRTSEVKPPAAEVKPKGEEKVYIPSIDDILARLDQEDEEEATR